MTPPRNNTTNLPVFIYALIDPFTGEIRYIGKSVRPKERLTNQCNEHSNTYRCHWIQSVLMKGKRPIQIILEELDCNVNWQEREKYWIAYGKDQGWKLTNTTDGGDGVLNLSGESKERMLKTWKGRKHKPETLLKIGAASKGRKFSEESLRKKSEKMKGRIFSPEHLDKIRKSNQKLSDDEVRDIKKMLAAGIAQLIIAKKYNVDGGTISNIKRKLTYRDVFDLLPQEA